MSQPPSANAPHLVIDKTGTDDNPTAFNRWNKRRDPNESNGTEQTWLYDWIGRKDGDVWRKTEDVASFAFCRINLDAKHSHHCVSWAPYQSLHMSVRVNYIAEASLPI